MTAVSRCLPHATCLLGVLTLAATAFGTDQIPWASDIPTALRMAATRNQLVMVHFTSDACPPCRRLEKNVFSQPSFAYSLTQEFVPVKVNVSRFPQIAQHYGVRAWPTDLMLAPNGQELHRMISPQNANQYATSLRQVAWRFRSQPSETMVASLPELPWGTQSSVKDAASAAAALGIGHSTSDSSPRTFGTTPNQGGGPSSLATATARQAPHASTSNTFATTAQNTSTYAAEHGVPNTSGGIRPVSGEAAADNSVTPTGYTQHTIATPYAGMSVTERSPMSVEGTGPQMVLNPNATPGGIGNLSAHRSAPSMNSTPTSTPSHSADDPSQLIVNVYAHEPNPQESEATTYRATTPTSKPTTPPAPSPTPADSTTTYGMVNAAASSPPASLEPSPALAQAPSEPGEFKLGIEGYCPVTLLEDDKWTQGDKRWGARHRGRVYLFQSAAAQQRFLSDPDKFSPVLAGFDPVSFRENQNYVEGKRQHGIRFQDQIILFSSEETLEKFTAAPPEYMTTVQQAMQQAGTLR